MTCKTYHPAVLLVSVYHKAVLYTAVMSRCACGLLGTLHKWPYFKIVWKKKSQFSESVLFLSVNAAIIHFHVANLSSIFSTKSSSPST